MLNYIHYPSTQSNKTPLVIVHGLYGSARNWGVISKRLSDEREVFAIDQRNHGDSRWCKTQSYFDMAGDLQEFLKHFGSMAVLGHSMGGKAAMVLSILDSNLVEKLIIADIAPVSYSHDNTQYIRAMKKVQLDRLNSIGGLKTIVPSEGIVFKYKASHNRCVSIPLPSGQITNIYLDKILL